MCDKVVDKAYVDGYVSRWEAKTQTMDCMGMGVVGYLGTLANMGNRVGNLCGECVVIEMVGSTYVISTKGRGPVPIYYCIDDTDPKKQLRYVDSKGISQNLALKNVTVRNGISITSPIPTKLVPIAGTDTNYLFLVSKECNNLPMPIYTYVNDTTMTSTATQEILTKYPLFGTIMNNCPTCSGNWKWDDTPVTKSP